MTKRREKGLTGHRRPQGWMKRYTHMEEEAVGPIEPLHPDVSYADLRLLSLVLIGLWLVVGWQIADGLWEKFYQVAVEWFPLWPWGG